MNRPGLSMSKTFQTNWRKFYGQQKSHIICPIFLLTIFEIKQKFSIQTMSLKQLSKVDKRTKYAVYGWVREQEKSLNSRVVPSMILPLCILYFRDLEMFGVVDNGAELSENNTIITRISDGFLDESINGCGIMEVKCLVI